MTQRNFQVLLVVVLRLILDLLCQHWPKQHMCAASLKALSRCALAAVDPSSPYRAHRDPQFLGIMKLADLMCLTSATNLQCVGQLVSHCHMLSQACLRLGSNGQRIPGAHEQLMSFCLLCTVCTRLATLSNAANIGLLAAECS